MLLNEDTDALSAIGISIALVWNNLAVMLVWGAIVIGLFVIALITGLFPYGVAYPLLVGFSSIPKVAVVPIFMLWFGSGTTPAILTAV